LTQKHKHRAVIDVDEELLDDISELINSKSETLLKNILADIYPADVALIIDNLEDGEGFTLFRMLDDETSAEVILELSEHKSNYFLERLQPEDISRIAGKMDSDDATDIISQLSKDAARDVLERMELEDSTEVKELMAYGGETAGGIMQKEFIDVKLTDTIDQAIKEIKNEAVDIEHVYHVWVTDDQRRLVGIVTLIKIILCIDSPAMIIADIMNPEVISVDVDTDQEEAAKIMQKYDLVSLPVTGQDIN
jgi:magnesium transporter